MNPSRDKTIICIDTLPAEIDAYYTPAVELIGDIYHVLSRLAEECRGAVSPGGSPQLREATLRLLEDARADDRFPVQPPRLLADIRATLGRDDVLISDVGLHKLWIGRAFPACKPGTTLIANGLAGMGFAVPAAIAAKLVRPQAKVVAVSGDGGFLMNAQELETARRLGTAFVNVVWENGQFGSIAWKQDARFGRHFGTGFTNPDFARLAESFGLPAWRIGNAAEFAPRLAHALTLSTPSSPARQADHARTALASASEPSGHPAPPDFLISSVSVADSCPGTSPRAFFSFCTYSRTWPAQPDAARITADDRWASSSRDPHPVGA